MHPGEDNRELGPFWLSTLSALPSLSVTTLPSALWCERLLARCKLGVLDSAGAATCYCDLSLDLADGVLGQANDAVTGTRLVTLNPPYIWNLNYATAGSVA